VFACVLSVPVSFAQSLLPPVQFEYGVNVCCRKKTWYAIVYVLRVLVYRARRSEARIQQMLWKINYSDIVFINTVRRVLSVKINA